MRAKNITARQFAEEIGIQPSGMSHILGGRNNPSLDFVAKVLRRYPEIDANWLILGRGEMYTSGAPVAPSAAEPAPLPYLFPPAPEGHDEPQPTIDEPVQEESYPIENEPLEESLPVPCPESPAPRRLAKLLFVYSDGTFEECLPAH